MFGILCNREGKATEAERHLLSAETIIADVMGTDNDYMKTVYRYLHSLYVRWRKPELAQKYNMELTYFVGFLDGINDSLKNPNPIEDMDANTVVSLDYDKEKLYYNMVAAKADWLYGLEQWDALLTPERRKELYKEQRSSTTVVKPPKIGRNDPCPCGSGKKYKKCCGRNN